MEATIPEIRIVSTEFKLEPNTLRVSAGQPVRLVIIIPRPHTQASTEHGLLIPALGAHLFTRAGEVAGNTLTFDKPGEYEIVASPKYIDLQFKKETCIYPYGLRD